MALFEPFETLSVDNNPEELPPIKIKKTSVRAPSVKVDGPSPITSKELKAMNKLYEEKKLQADDPQKKATIINRIDKYLKQFPTVAIDKVYEKKKYELSEEQLKTIEKTVTFQLSEGMQFQIGKRIFIDLVAKLPVLGNKAFNLGYCIDNLPQYVEANYKEFEPTWTEIVIKYNLFSTGPELRLLMQLMQTCHELDIKNRNRLHESMNEAQRKMKKPNNKFDKDL